MNTEELTGDTPAASEEEGAKQNVTMPLGVGDFADQFTQDPLAGAKTTKRLNGGAALIVAVVLIAVAGLFSMRKLAQVTVLDRVVTQVKLPQMRYVTQVHQTLIGNIGLH